MVFECLLDSGISPQVDLEVLPHCFRNPATLVNPTFKVNLFSTRVKVWNTLTFVKNSSLLDVTEFLPYTKWTLADL